MVDRIGMAGETQDAELAFIEPIRRKKSKLQWAIEITFSVGLIVAMFTAVIPRVIGSDYQDVWAQFQKLSVADIAILCTIWAASLYAYTFVLTSVLPGLMHMQALVLNLAGSAVSNTVPFGGTLGVGVTYGMLYSWGFPVSASTLAILLTGFWNIFAKLGTPALALIVIVLAGDATWSLVVAAIIGIGALAGAILIFALILKSERLAAAIGGLGGRVVSFCMRLFRRPPVRDWDRAAVDFRRHSIWLVRRRWLHITIAMVIYTVTLFAILLASLRFVGVTEDEIAWPAVFAAFAFGRLLSAIPLTPDGFGFVEAGLAGTLLAFGGTGAEVGAGVLLFRSITFLFEIPVGAVGYVTWLVKKGWRKLVVAGEYAASHGIFDPSGETRSETQAR